MNCAGFASAKHDLIDRELPDAQACEALAHAKDCAACGAELRELEGLRTALLACPQGEWPAAARVRAMGALLEAAARECPSPPEVMTLAEVAAHLRVTQAAVRTTLDRIPHFEIGGEVRFRRAGLERWIEREEARPADAGLTGPVLTLIRADAIPGALAG